MALIIFFNFVAASIQGTTIYAQISQTDVESKGPMLNLNKTYTISKFNVKVSKTSYVPFVAEFMIEFTSFTTVVLVRDPLDTFPACIYNITSFNEIQPIGQAATKFIGKLKCFTLVLFIVFNAFFATCTDH